MGEPRSPAPVKLFAGMLASDERLFGQAASLLEQNYGPADCVSGAIPFGFTEYYEKEMGRDLLRKFVFFKELIDPGCLYQVKLDAVEKEKHFACSGGRRKLNIDPGYVSAAKVVLATTKNYDHRVYLARGIYGEVALHFRKGSFIPWEWTYPDYRTSEYIEIFNRARGVYMEDAGLRKKEGEDG